MLRLILRAYPALALLASVFFLSPVFTFIPLLLTGFYLCLRLTERTLFWARINLFTDLFLLFALTLFFQPELGLFSVPISLPMLGTLSLSLEEASYFSPVPSFGKPRQPSNISLGLFSIAILILLLSLLLGEWALSLASVVSILFLLSLVVIILKKMSAKSLEEEKIELRLVAGTRVESQLKLKVQTSLGGKAFLSSPYDWLKLEPEAFSLAHAKELSTKLSLTPPLSGPSEPELVGQVVDRWGLVESNFKLRPMWLYVIPRARYAAWLARKYLEGTKPGTLSLPSTLSTFQATSPSRTGIEYCGSRAYQPGDSPKFIDWKHSAKLGSLVSKEFSELKGRAALVLINLAAREAEEADKLAYKIITTALSLAQEGIPAAISAYDPERVRLTTTTLPPRALLTQALDVAEQMVSFVDPVKYLAPPNVERLRANLFRLRQVESQPAKALNSLLEAEYKSLEDIAKESPATAALVKGLKRQDKDLNLVVISERNHDAEALAFNLFKFSRQGYGIIEI